MVHPEPKDRKMHCRRKSAQRRVPWAEFPAHPRTRKGQRVSIRHAGRIRVTNAAAPQKAQGGIRTIRPNEIISSLPAFPRKGHRSTGQPDAISLGNQINRYKPTF